jgi:hypothetical protein
LSFDDETANLFGHHPFKDVVDHHHGLDVSFLWRSCGHRNRRGFLSLSASMASWRWSLSKIEMALTIRSPIRPSMSFDRGIRGVKIDVAFGLANRFDDFLLESAEFLDGFEDQT